MSAEQLEINIAQVSNSKSQKCEALVAAEGRKAGMSMSSTIERRAP